MRKLLNEAFNWRLSGVLCVLAMVVCPSRSHCVPGKEWQITGGVQDDEGANTYTTAYINVSYVDPATKRFYVEKSEIGKYGDGRIGPAEGVLVHVSSEDGDHTGCQVPLRNSWGDGSFPKEPWIALIKRGQCSFEMKIENAYRHNATAVLVYNDRESPILDKMKLNSVKSGTRNMSAIFTYKWKGEQLARLVDNGSRVMMHITVATRCTRSSNHVNRTSVLFVSISFVVLMLISMAWLVFYYVQRFRYMHAKERLSKRLCSAAKKALSKIPTKEIQQEDSEVQGDGECCAVCIEPYKVTDDLRILPCSHEFHKGCIDPWLLEHRTCPMCKMDILKHYGFVFSNSQESILEIDIERDGNTQNLENVTVTEDTLVTRNETRAAEFEAVATDPGEMPDEVCEHCIKCRCRGKGAPAGKSGEGCCLIGRNTAQIVGGDETQSSDSDASSPSRRTSEKRTDSSQTESVKFLRSENCDSKKEEGFSWSGSRDEAGDGTAD
ncbi:UNVERIFIED_CONTAM: hypothetical protein PYX00_006060 [Menopon gallinae]|uniref:RING-type domain-containing protein n=1 Tax=Menopon gallinae TaxID=328185 RepID=A0AAW2HU28_9NEOP